MPQNINPEYVVGGSIEPCKPLKIFSEEACEFLNCVSGRLLKNSVAKKFSDVIAFGFWCRRASIRKMAAAYKNDELRQGRGLAFHIAPSNVAVNFAYSFAAGLLAGNANVVRLPSKNFQQTDIICSALKETLAKDFPQMIPYVQMVRYGHETAINDALSALCDVRVIWGGDETIKSIRKSPLKVRAKEITFADRYGLAIIDADKYLEATNKERLAKDFFNDTYLTDQNACSSPKYIFWLGKNIEAAKEIFWKSVHREVAARYKLQGIQAVDKMTLLYLLGAAHEAKFISSCDNRLFRAEIESVTADLINFQGNSGFFIECNIKSLEDILPLCGDKCQTVAYYGLNSVDWHSFLSAYRPRGIDRIVPLGKTLDFTLTWDGCDLIREMSRQYFIIRAVTLEPEI